MKKWFTYIVECSDKTLYTGVTTDINRRLKEHNSGIGSKYTRGRKPVKLQYLQEFENRSQAGKEECRIKKLSRKEKLVLIENKNLFFNK